MFRNLLPCPIKITEGSIEVYLNPGDRKPMYCVENLKVQFQVSLCVIEEDILPSKF